MSHLLYAVLWCCWLGGRKGIRPVKNWVVGCWRGCLGWGADLHIAQPMPLPLTISCSSKSRLVLTFLVLPFWYLLTRVVPDIFQKSSKTVVCVSVWANSFTVYSKPINYDSRANILADFTLKTFNLLDLFSNFGTLQHIPTNIRKLHVHICTSYNLSNDQQ